MNILEILKFEYFIAIAIGYVVYQVIRYFVNLVYSNMIQKRHQANAKLTREVRDKKIQAFVIKYGNNSSLTREEICKIINLSLYELSEAIKNKSITSVRATLIYALNCCTVGKELEAIADCDFEKALEEAVNADKIINSTEKSKLPLLIGVPISIKDHIRVKGYLDTLGYCSLYNNKSPKNCYFVDELIKLGAVILCKSNIPQGLLAAESKNLIWGNSKNIWDLTRTSGGSSGGEGSLISSFCSPVGLGTDVAGSIRIPAYYSGIYGFKTTSNKTSLNGYKVKI